jgi:hypothetical protein
MNVDCHWVEKNLEALFCDGLDAEDSRIARQHLETCMSCRNEVRALNAIDPLIKNYFQRELEAARRPRALDTRKVFGLSGAAVALVAILLFVVLRTPQTTPLPTATSRPQIGPTASTEAAPPIKDTSGGEIERAKPSAEPVTPADQNPIAAAPLSATLPEFLVTDPAGYTRTLDDYRGHIVVIGVWTTGQPESTANLDRLYKAFGANPKFRFLGISNQRFAKPANVTFPAVYNQGSRLFGAQPGEFVVLDENGSVELRGSLVKDFNSLRKALAK